MEHQVEIKVLQSVRQSLEAVHVLTTNIAADLTAIASNYEEFAKVNESFNAAFTASATQRS